MLSDSAKAYKMYSSVSPIYENSNIMQFIFGSTGKEYEILSDISDEILRETFPQTAISWGLDSWERRLGLATNHNETVEKRRSKIMGKIQSRAIITPERMAYVINKYTNETVDIEENIFPYIFRVNIITDGASNSSEVNSIVKKIKPSHLGFELTYNSIDKVNIKARTNYYLFNTSIAGTLPYREFRGGISKENINVCTAKNNFIYTTILSNKDSKCGNAPYKNIKGVLSLCTVVSELDAKGYLCVSIPSGKSKVGTIPYRNMDFYFKDVNIGYSSDVESCLFSSSLCNSDICGTIPGANMLGINYERSINMLPYSKFYKFRFDISGTNPKRQIKSLSNKEDVELEAGVISFQYKNEICGNVPNKSCESDLNEQSVLPSVQSKEYSYKVKRCGKRYTGRR